MSRDPERCSWAPVSELDSEYHDTEWGVPSRDDRHLFEMLILEGVQAGLGWSMILEKRLAYREAYHDFDAIRVARFDARRRVWSTITWRDASATTRSIRHRRAGLTISPARGISICSRRS